MSTDGSFNSTRYAQSGYTLESPAEAARIAASLDLLGKLAPRRILDVGCSDGLISAVLKERFGAWVMGLDASEPALEKARQVCDETRRVEFGDCPIPLDDACVDAIHAGEVIEHLFYTERFLEELLRIVKPGGGMVLTTPNLASWYNRVFVLLGYHPLFTDVGVRVSSCGNPFYRANLPAGHIRNFTKTSLVHLLASCGWQVEEVRGVALLGNKWRFLDRWISRLFPGLAADLVILCRRPAAS